MFENDSYEEDVKLFKKVTSTQADELLSNEGIAVTYIGRSTCPYCRKFAKKLSALTSKINTTIYYVDSVDSSDDSINSFREKYNIVTVPGFIVSKNMEIEVRCDSSLPEDEILDLLK
ncbi:putative bacteriocin transport accessory protein [Clostridium saccharoperbutylacetonicum]|uniref:Thioredoxin-like protein n=1 Tax=Clostridium saccharoperbutylacetonicum N1-4(HMT) TaxID=931276 RepID=M1MRA9_9CLOT|nr:thiol reductase thioredoxin [Clostridium saccharoperbutylacetonicum]AGF57271.1 thioredoxin-like protein [Clostridium saccharoperbutylacetonicum N1-4(HMT)]NRT61967.1 putative bacteriocin transport accessory protein [Clostridium saccharoperbutylacetonicum]NSB25296.1 putative bacteriocin transport accessory protein [Clostridium saccharoperbutylacetonicum]NSB44665.1 putative bacteriocin transport accessory protein [Clostridium saccharoperbutylacetonicum]